MDGPQPLAWRELHPPAESPGKRVKMTDRKMLQESAALVRPRPVDIAQEMPVYLVVDVPPQGVETRDRHAHGMPHGPSRAGGAGGGTTSATHMPDTAAAAAVVEVPSLRDCTGELNLSVTLFERPATLIRAPDEPVDALDARVLYEASEEDLAFLDALNAQRASEGKEPVAPEVLERLIDRLEKESMYEQAQIEQQRGTLNLVCDEDIVCAVCLGAESEDANQIVFCDRCNVPVHQECYGVPTIPEGEWLCRRCAAGADGAQARCPLCPSTGGAFARTDDPDRPWCHVACAIWIPGPWFQYPERMEPICGLQHVDRARFALVCTLCGRRGGACIQCAFGNCTRPFHVTCAQYAGLQMEMDEGRDDGEGVRLRAYCSSHSTWRRAQSTTHLLRHPDRPVGCRAHSVALERARLLFDPVAPATARRSVLVPDAGSEAGELTLTLNPCGAAYPPLLPDVLDALYAHWIQQRQRRGGALLLPVLALARALFPPREPVTPVGAGAAGTGAASAGRVRSGSRGRRRTQGANEAEDEFEAGDSEDSFADFSTPPPPPRIRTGPAAAGLRRSTGSQHTPRTPLLPGDGGLVSPPLRRGPGRPRKYERDEFGRPMLDRPLPPFASPGAAARAGAGTLSVPPAGSPRTPAGRVVAAASAAARKRKLRLADLDDAFALRLQLEKARDLLYLVKRRERRKLDAIDLGISASRLRQDAAQALLAAHMRRCATVLKRLSSYRLAAPFLDPVDPLSFDPPLDDYHAVVTQPMDLGTVKKRLEQRQYTAPGAFAADVRLTFDNCILYNGAHSPYGRDAQDMLRAFDRLMRELVWEPGAALAAGIESWPGWIGRGGEEAGEEPAPLSEPAAAATGAAWAGAVAAGADPSGAPTGGAQSPPPATASTAATVPADAAPPSPPPPPPPSPPPAPRTPSTPVAEAVAAEPAPAAVLPMEAVPAVRDVLAAVESERAVSDCGVDPMQA